MQALIDGSRLITEALVRAGAEVFIGYPITPANNLYLFSGKRFKTFFAAPDEITTLQWMSGFSAAGKLSVTATSFPGFALMLESINMAYMMELPMVIDHCCCPGRAIYQEKAYTGFSNTSHKILPRRSRP